MIEECGTIGVGYCDIPEELKQWIENHKNESKSLKDSDSEISGESILRKYLYKIGEPTN